MEGSEPHQASMESTGAPIHPSASTKDVVLTATHLVSVGGGGGGGPRGCTLGDSRDSGGDREGGQEGGGGPTRARTLGDFRQSSSLRTDLEIQARRRRHCPRKSHKVLLEIGRAQAGSDHVLWHEGHIPKPIRFHMKDVYRVEQKRTKGKRDGRLHVTLTSKFGFYRYRFDFPDEAACAQAADAMLEHRTYKAPTEIKLRVCTWNMGNALPQVRALRRAHGTRTAHAHAHAHAPHTYTCTRALRAMLRPPQADLPSWLGPCYTSYGYTSYGYTSYGYTSYGYTSYGSTSYGSTSYFRPISPRGWAATPTCMPWAYRRRACTTEGAALLHPLYMLHP